MANWRSFCPLIAFLREILIKLWHNRCWLAPGSSEILSPENTSLYIIHISNPSCKASAVCDTPVLPSRGSETSLRPEQVWVCWNPTCSPACPAAFGKLSTPDRIDLFILTPVRWLLLLRKQPKTNYFSSSLEIHFMAWYQQLSLALRSV